ncbi:hypothetical protein JCM1841_000703 [Sporobolomyces salmonicolor]
MSSWRGGAHLSATTSSRGGFSSFTSAPQSTTDHGRGRGRGRGTSNRGAGAPGLNRRSNLSWRRTDAGGGPDTPQAADEADTEEDAGADEAEQQGTGEQPQSAFAAFGASGQAKSAFGAGGAFGPFGGGTTGSAEGSAFGGRGFGAGGFRAGTSAFGAPAATTATSTPSTFASTSVFAPAPSSAFSAPASTSSAPFPPAPTSEPTPNAALASKRAPGQISTLEVLGEDSDARKKRFEATLPNNRYLELKPLREEQRLQAIKDGLIPDPSKPMRLDEATDFEGTCEEMCPEWEREEREYQNNVDPLERYPGTTRIDPARAVKAFHRPAAGNDQPLPSDVRPPPVLRSTLDYLFHTLLPTQPLAVTHPFIRDRTRSIRQDFTVQNVRGTSAIECNERIARYHILALGVLREQSGFSESQELEQLRKVLKSLNEFYDDARLSKSRDISFPNEPEFRAYNILTHLRDPDIIWSTELLPPNVFSHPLLQTALSLHRLAQKSNLPRGERASLNAFSRFFKLVADPKVPYLFGCILSTHFGEIRRNAIEALRGAFLKQHSAFPLRTLTKMLGCDDEEETRDVCEQLGVVVRVDEKGRAMADLHKGAILKSTTLKPKVSRRLVEAKRGSTPYQAVIDGDSYVSNPVEPVPPTPSLATPPAFAFPPASANAVSPLSAPAATFPTLSRPSVFANPLASAFSSGVPTPVPTPPPRSVSPSSSTPAPKPAPKPALNAAAPVFVPSLGAPKPAAPAAAPLSQPTSAAPAFSFAPTPAAPPPLAPQAFLPAPTPVGASPFSFASTAPPPPLPSVPPPAPPTAAPVPPPVHRPPPSALRSSISPLPPPVESASTLPAAAGPTAPSPKLARASPSPTLRRGSAISVPSAARPAAPPRKPLIDALCHDLTASLLLDAVAGPVRRAAESALRERWASITAREARAKKALGEKLARTVLREMGAVYTREVAFGVVRDERRKRVFLLEWVERTERRIERKEEDDEKKRVWGEVVRGIGAGGRRGREREEEVEMSEEEDEGVAGTEEAGLDFGALSLSAGADAGEVGRMSSARENDEDMAERLRTAAAARERIWSRGTFLNILSQHASSAVSGHRFPRRPTWTTLVAIPARTSPFASWLACKFDLESREGRVEVDTQGVEVAVRLLEKGEAPAEEASRLAQTGATQDLMDLVKQELSSTGLVVFDCTAGQGAAFDWSSAQTRLQDQLNDIDRRSLFKPSLLVVVCPDRALSSMEETALRQKIADNLSLPALTSTVSASSVLIIHLDGAEADFDLETAKLLEPLSVREERIPRPLAAYAKPLLDVWRASLRDTLSRCRRDSSAPSITSTYTTQLQVVVREIEAVAVRPPSPPLSLPPLPTNSHSFRSIVESYVASLVFASTGHFPDIATALAQRPAIPDHALARLLLELLAQFIVDRISSPSSRPTTRQASLDVALFPALERVDDSLRIAAERLQRVVEEDDAVVVEDAAMDAKASMFGSGKKKRKASAAPAELEAINRSPKKQTVNGINGVHLIGTVSTTAAADVEGSEDRLSALEILMRDAKALLATR